MTTTPICGGKLTSLLLSASAAAATFMFLSSAASAHITLANAETTPNSYYKAVLQVPHGCAGEATTEIRVQIPDGVVGVKPMPKPGWTLTTVRGAYAKPHESHGHTQTEGVREIVWSGGNLSDDNYDEFVFASFIVGTERADQKVYFPIVQQCTTSKTRWIEIPAAGQATHDLKSPAPALRVAAKGDTVAQAMPPMAGHQDVMPMAAAPSSAKAEPVVAASDPMSGSDTFKAGDIVVTAPWTRATPGGAKIASGYLQLKNTGSTADRFTGGTSDIAGSVQVHEMSMNNGVMQMRQLSTGLEIKPGETVAFKPGGYHLMFVDLKQPLKEGDTVKATLQFEKGGKVAVTFAVAGIGSSAAPHQHRM